MQLKTVSSIGLAFLLVFGVVGVASAQEVAATQGILIRVDRARRPTRGSRSATTIKVRILCYDGRLGDTSGDFPEWRWSTPAFADSETSGPTLDPLIIRFTIIFPGSDAQVVSG